MLLAIENVFKVAPTTVIILAKSDYNVTVKFGNRAHHLYQHACFLDTSAVRNLI